MSHDPGVFTDTPVPLRRFLRPAEIRQITDPAELQALHDKTLEGVSYLETKLEFPIKDDPEWDLRTKSALSVGRTALQTIEARMRFFPEFSGQLPASDQSDMALKNQQLKRLIERDRVTLEKVKFEHVKALANHQSKLAHHQTEVEAVKARTALALAWQTHFVRAARRVLPPETLAQIEALADGDCLDCTKRELGRAKDELVAEKNQD